MTGAGTCCEHAPVPHHTHAIGGGERMARSKSIAERFWSKVDRRGHGECWPWLASKDGHKRGEFYWSPAAGKITAPRAVWWLTHGAAPPSDLQVCHSCDYPACVNPAHLWLGDYSANARDAVAKGRLVAPVMYGAANPNGRRTHCKRGHLLAGDNLRIVSRKEGRSSRLCLTCQRANQRKYDQRRRSRAKEKSDV
jgi:hypothetical protein